MTLLFLGIGFGIGFIAQRGNFCIVGSFVEYFSGGMTRRLKGLVAAMSVFALVHFWGFDTTGGCPNIGWGEYMGLHNLIGGFAQGIGYIIGAACPLSLLVRIGEGSRFHVIVAIGFIIGVGIYACFLQNIYTVLSPYIYKEAATLMELWS